MSTLKRTAVIAVLIGLLATAVAVTTGCRGKPDYTTGRLLGPQKSAKRGGTVTFLIQERIGSLDPATVSSSVARMIHGTTNRTLYTYKPPKYNKSVPDLAAADPKISADQRTITIPLKSDVTFSAPVNRTVTSADVKYALERAFTVQVASKYALRYFRDIIGAPNGFGAYRQISGIETPDPSTLVIRLRTPTASNVIPALVLPITTPVPQEYAAPFDAKTPSAYGAHAVATGPYKVKANKAALALVRNPGWNASSDFRPAYLDGINFQFKRNLDQAAAAALTGKNMLCCSRQPSPTLVSDAYQAHGGKQIAETPARTVNVVSFNPRQEPFNNINFRRAFFAALDRNSLRIGNSSGGVATHFIPPAVTDFGQLGDVEGFVDLDFTQHSRGFPELALKYLKAAKRDGLPVAKDRYAGKSVPLIYWSPETDADTRFSFLVRQGLSRLGVLAKLVRVSPAEVRQRCASKITGNYVCGLSAIEADFLDPLGLVANEILGARQAARVAGTMKSGEARIKAFKQVNESLVNSVAAVPWVWNRGFALSSRNVLGVASVQWSNWDLSYTAMKH